MAAAAAEESESETARILDACERKDIDELRDLAIAPGGFLSDPLRSRACKYLLGLRLPIYISPGEHLTVSRS